jgi:hypothetical protein
LTVRIRALVGQSVASLTVLIRALSNEN